MTFRMVGEAPLAKQPGFPVPSRGLPGWPVESASMRSADNLFVPKPWSLSSESYAAETHMLRVNIFNLRNKIEIGGAPRYLVNEPGIGYRLMELPIE